MHQLRVLRSLNEYKEIMSLPGERFLQKTQESHFMGIIALEQRRNSHVCLRAHVCVCVCSLDV